MRFTVTVREIHCSYREVEADTWKEAVEKAQNCETEVSCEYSHTPDLPITITEWVPPFRSQPSVSNDTDDYNEEPESEKDKQR